MLLWFIRSKYACIQSAKTKLKIIASNVFLNLPYIESRVHCLIEPRQKLEDLTQKDLTTKGFSKEGGEDIGSIQALLFDFFTCHCLELNLENASFT